MTTLILLALPSAFAVDVSVYRAGLAEQAGWEDVARKKADGVGEILIRHKVVAGTDCLEGTTSAALPPKIMLDVATDIPHQPSWSSWKVPASVKLDGGATEFDYYQVLDNPAPIADRYWFLHGTALQVGADHVFRWEFVDPSVKWSSAVADLLVKWPSAVMTTVNVGDWTFSPNGADTNVRYRICTDPGGNIPRWVGEIAATSTLPTNVADLVAEVRRRVGG